MFDEFWKHVNIVNPAIIKNIAGTRFPRLSYPYDLNLPRMTL